MIVLRDTKNAFFSKPNFTYVTMINKIIQFILIHSIPAMDR